jgi:phosphoglycerate dehydrogenase-like enzyme
VHVAPSARVDGPATEAELERAVCDAGGRTTLLHEADAVVWPSWGDADALSALLDQAPRVSWVQLVTSGVDSLLPALDGQRLVTSAKGAYSGPIAEHVVAVTLALLRDVPGYARSRDWRPRPAATLHGTRVTILGGGGIASALLELLPAFGCRTTVVRRRVAPMPGAVDVVGPDQLPEVAGHTDVLVLALPLTQETHHLVDAELLARLPPTAVLVNVSRGAHVDMLALADALKGGRLAGAALDVTDPEPLPPESPLWQLDRCLVTPHVACTPGLGREHLLERVRENVRRRRAGLPLLGAVDPTLGY